MNLNCSFAGICKVARALHGTVQNSRGIHGTHQTPFGCCWRPWQRISQPHGFTSNEQIQRYSQSSIIDMLTLKRILLRDFCSSSGPISFGFASLENAVTGIENAESIIGSPTSASPSPPSPPLGDELAAVRTMERAHQTDPILHHSQVLCL